MLTSDLKISLNHTICYSMETNKPTGKQLISTRFTTCLTKGISHVLLLPVCPAALEWMHAFSLIYTASCNHSSFIRVRMIVFIRVLLRLINRAKVKGNIKHS